VATIKEVAERARVSTATVSRALTGRSTVTPELQQRIMAAVTELEYRPNRLASNLRRQTTETVGVVVSDIENPHYTQAVRAVEDALYQRGYRVLLCNTDETPAKQQSYLEVLAAERVVGVILAPSDPAGVEIGRLLSTGTPVVAFDRRVDDPRADAVVVDNARGTRRATDYLISLGHDRIGFVSGLPDIQTGRERLAGYQEAMVLRGLPLAIETGAFRMDEAFEATNRLLDSGYLTALLVANNLMTIGAMRAVRSRRLRIPQDIALIAVDDPPWAELVEPPLTTLAQPVRQMADCAVRLLFERISGKRMKAKTELFEFELVVRESSGDPIGAGHGMERSDIAKIDEIGVTGSGGE
jgi:DNA-binding LacI/PurR family transcriptional regulator